MDVSMASLPRKISVMTACSGSGIFELAATAVKDELNRGLLDSDPPFKVTYRESYRVKHIDVDKGTIQSSLVAFDLPVWEVNISEFHVES